MPKLSIITPVYNSVQFIESCIQNVIAQKCSDIEHIIVDGGSVDGTNEIITKYADKFPHIRWISEKDNGQSDAMNKGIKMAKGDIIGFLNADDGYFDFTLNRVIAIFKNNHTTDFIVGNCKLVDTHSNIVYINRPQRLRSYHFYSKLEPYPINPVAYFYKKSIHGDNEVGFYNEQNHYNMDYEFFLKVCLKYNLVYFNEDWGYMLAHPEAKTSQDKLKNELQKRKDTLFIRYYEVVPFKYKFLAKLYKLYKRAKLYLIK